jgi:hypothetical protein
MKQHYIPQCYLAAWVDPAAPLTHEPYVWVFPALGGQGRRKAPKNIFRETDFYTIKDAERGLELVLEKGLSQLEQRFTSVRSAALARRLPVSASDRLSLCAFASAMRGRTKARREHTRTQWKAALDLGNSIREQALKVTPEQRAAMASAVPGDPSRSLTRDDVQRIVDEPIQTTLPARVQVETPFLMRFNLAILCASSSPGFVTSDDPCVRHVPGAEPLPLNQRLSGVVHRDTEITLPVSPSQLMVLNLRGLDGYYECSEAGLASYNRRTCWFAHESVVVSGSTPDPDWFPKPAESDERRAGQPN